MRKTTTSSISEIVLMNNTEKYIVKYLDFMINQRYQNGEIIIVNYYNNFYNYIK